MRFGRIWNKIKWIDKIKLENLNTMAKKNKLLEEKKNRDRMMDMRAQKLREQKEKEDETDKD